MSNIHLTIRTSARQRKTILVVILLLNLVMLAGTWLFNRYYYDVIGQDWQAGSGVKWVLLQFYLATENVLAVWYSSMLLLVAALACLLCFAMDVQRFKRGPEHYLSYGWALMASVFALLSLDEMGSIHEKIGNMTHLNPFGNYPLGWVYVLGIPIALVGMLMLGFGWVHLRRTPVTLSFFVLGVLLFLSVPLQEKFETLTWHAAANPSLWRRPVLFLLLEEGAELFGTFSFIVAAILYMQRAGKDANATGTAQMVVVPLSFTGKAAFWVTSLLIGAFAASLWATRWIDAHVVQSKGMEGIARNWYPSASTFLVAVICLYLYTHIRDLHRYVKFNYLLLTLLSIGMSAYFGSNLYKFTLGKEALLPQLIHGAPVFLAFLIFIQTVVSVKDAWRRLGAIAWVAFLCLAFSTGQNHMAEITFLASASLLISLVVHLNQWHSFSKN